MFEKALLARTGRSRWSWTGLLVQAGVVAALVIVPMVHPEVMSVIMPKALIYVPMKQPKPVEVEVRQSRTSSTNESSPVVLARPAAEPFRAPTDWSRPAAQIIDGPDTVFIPIASSPVIANTNSIFNIGGSTQPPSAPPPPAERKPEAPKLVRVGGEVRPPQILHRVNPIYPPLAKAARISGTVKLEGIIAKNGTVTQLKVLGGHPLLVKAAVDAVVQWRYTPTLLNKEPVEVIAPIDVNFILSN